MQFLHAPRPHELRAVVHLMRRQLRALPLIEEQFPHERPHSGDIRLRARHGKRIPTAHHTAGKDLLHTLEQRVALPEDRRRLVHIPKLNRIRRLLQEQTSRQIKYSIVSSAVRLVRSSKSSTASRLSTAPNA